MGTIKSFKNCKNCIVSPKSTSRPQSIFLKSIKKQIIIKKIVKLWP